MRKITPLPDIEITVPEKVNAGWEMCDRQVHAGKADEVFIYHQGGPITYGELQKLQNLEAAVVGAPDPTITHRVKAFITLKPAIGHQSNWQKKSGSILNRGSLPAKSPKI